MSANVSRKEIERRAAEWILQRDAGHCTDAERAQLEAWLAQDSRHREAYLSLDQAWDVAAGLKRWDPRDGRIDPDLLTPQHVPFVWKPLLLAASVLVAAMILGWLVYLHKGATYETPIGGYERVALEDGSVVQLNTNTAVRAHLTSAVREVRMLRGEAYFDVAFDPHRPFQVLVGNTIVRALGTAFSIRVRSDERMELVVTQGKVMVEGEGKRSLVAAGQTVQADEKRVAMAPVPQVEMARRLSWQTGQLVFDKQPLSRVVEEFNRYNRRQVRIASPELSSMELTGNFKASDLDSFVAAVRSALGETVEVESAEDEVVVRER